MLFDVFFSAAEIWRAFRSANNDHALKTKHKSFSFSVSALISSADIQPYNNEYVVTDKIQ